MPKLLEGDVVDNKSADTELSRLREQNRALVSQLSDVMAENEDLRKRVSVADAPIHRLREKLQPFYGLLQAIFGDIDELAPDAGTAASVAPAGMDPRVKAVWDSWKQKLGETPSAIIDALMTHGEANTQQLQVICKRARQTISAGIWTLNKSALIIKNGGRFSLKKL